ncbi:haloacid dehalogenase-like hydrolase domain-containing 5 [Chelonus insularis]|uniref:haloacid dehalogenase-like hydrolase domain-containing 5 n=1 Tax=Chelonus insularis TaxID=460826 RepID=UPI00158E6702|nr:haloacid dehalogenase-like hydrolase domain-containing 5 [Chelonus insularis]
MAIMKILLRPEISKFCGIRNFSSKPKPKFGIIFDIDGVIVRGNTVLSPVPEAFKRLRESNGKFRIPTLFVTNSGSSLPAEKAEDLSKWIGCEITEDQVVLAHSPLQMFKQFHNKHVLISGQGRIKQIASELGFKSTITINELVENFPSLDYVNKDKRNPRCGPIDPNFKPIEGIVLLSEPIIWETPLQLMVDLLISNGMPSGLPSALPYPHIPVIACNMDLFWVSEAPIPRYGHGAFLVCLESLYKKATGKDLIYSALVGKPSEVTYYHANQMIMNYAKKIGIDHNIDTIYAVGDNINTDIFGANLYDKYLARYSKGKMTKSRGLESLLGDNLIPPNIKACISILVETGVHKRDSEFKSDHCPRDFLPLEEGLSRPAFVVKDVGEAINLILEEENVE